MSNINTPFWDKNEADNRFYSSDQGKQFENIVANIADGTGGKSYPSIAVAMAVLPLPSDGIMFSVDQANVLESGVYAYDSTQVNGYRFVRGFADGKVEIGNKLPVSGDAATKPLLKKIVPLIEIGAIATATGEPAGSSTRVRTQNFIAEGNKLILDSSNLLIRSVFYYLNGVYVSMVNAALVKEYNLNFPSGTNQFKVVLCKNPDTTIIDQVDVNNSKLTVQVNRIVDVSGVEDLKPIQTDYDKTVYNVNTSLNERGGIATVNGVPADNTIRIRSKDFVNFEQGIYEIKNVPAGYYLNRMFRYKDGALVNSIANAPLIFTVDPAVANQYKFVFSKLNPNDVISLEEVSRFNYEIFLQGDTKKMQRISANAAKVPLLERRIGLLESSGNTYWKGKIWSLLSDSIGYGLIPANSPGAGGQLDSWAKLAAAELGMVFQNLGISGSTIGHKSETDTTSSSPFINRTSAINPNADLIMVAGSTNDLRKIKRMGVLADRVPYTFKGALNILLEDLHNRFVYNNLENPKTIVVVTPIKIYPDTPQGVEGLTIKDYRDAIIEIANYWNVPVFDAWAESGLVPGEFRTLQGTDPNYMDMYNPYVSDGVHPTQAGHKYRFMPSVVGFLKALR